MYGIYANIGGILMVNVTIYSIHGSYGYIIRVGPRMGGHTSNGQLDGKILTNHQILVCYISYSD